MAYLDDEASSAASEPRELLTLEVNPPTGQVWRHTSATRDIDVNGVFFKAIAMTRGGIAVAMISGGENGLEIVLPIDHALVKLYLRQGVPPSRIRATLQRLQLRSGEVRQLWTGDITSLSCVEGTARFLVPAKTMETIKRMLPIITAGRACPHILYGEGGCHVVRTSSFGPTFKLTTTVIAVSGREVRVDLSNVPTSNPHRALWTRFGELVHTASGERQSIADQVDLNPGVSTVANLTMFERIPDMKVGDSVDVYAGCDHTVLTCREKFANQLNFGGLPELPTKNPFVPNSFGIYQE